MQTTNVMVGERPRSFRKRLQHTQGLARAPQWYDHAGTSADRVRGIQPEASVSLRVVAAKSAPRLQAVAQKSRFAVQSDAAFHLHQSGSGAAHQLPRLLWLRSIGLRSIGERHHDRVGGSERLSAGADQLQYLIENEAFGLKQIAIGVVARGQAAFAYLLVQFGKCKQSAQGLLARNRFKNAIALL